TFRLYVYTLPEIRVEAGATPDTATVYFPPVATVAEIRDYLAGNQLTLRGWLRSGDAPLGRIALVSLPSITPTLVDAANGVWRADVPKHIERAKIEEWAAASGIQILGYDPETGV